jgi:hypothetical protein
MRPGLLCDLLDSLLVSPGEHDLVAGLARQRDDGRADPLAASGDEKTACLHGMIPLIAAHSCFGTSLSPRRRRRVATPNSARRD